MRTASRITVSSALIGVALVTTGQDAASQEPGPVAVVARETLDLNALRQWDATVDGMLRSGDLVAMSRLGEQSMRGRVHEYLAQHYRGIPVHGGGVSRQLDSSGVTTSLFGTLHQGTDVDTTPALSGVDVALLLEKMHGGNVAAGQPFLTVLPLLNGSYALTYRIGMSDGRFYFADADDGRIAYTIDAFRSQAAVGGGIGYKGVRKKMSTTRAGSRYEAHDLLRPGAIVTLDGRLNTPRVYRLLYDHFLEGLPEGEPLWTPHDIATDADNDWHDPAVVDGHAHTGWTYDYFFQRHGWKGIDGEDGRILSIVNLPVRNAFFFSPPYGPEGTGVMVYGRAEFATSEEPWTNLDTVGHEMMHGVAFHALNRRTESPFGLANDVAASSRLGPPSFIDGGGKTHTCATARFPGRIATPDGWKNVPLPAFCVDGRFVLSSHQGWSIDEGYADIMAQAVEFFHVNAGATADYLVEGDQGMPIIRSPVDPRSIPLSPVIPQWRYPDTYGDRYEFALVRSDEGFVTFSPFVFSDGQFAFALGGPGYGGSHWNSTILSHAFYLAIEGGTHRTSGMTVEGVGGANRDEIERIFFRALTDLMPAATSFPMAAAVLRQSAADLAPGSDGERAVEEALRAVGLPPSR